MTQWMIGVDIGGTFTDFMLYDTASGAVHVHKVPLHARGARAGDGQRPRRALRRRGPRAGGRHGRLPRHHGRDERRARARGRRRRDDHDARLPRHRPHRPPPAPAALLGDAGHPVAGAAVRAAPPPQGRDRADRAARRARSSCRSTRTRCAPAARELRAEGVEAVAVCFLFSYLNPEHERRAAEIVREEMPDAFVTTSADIVPQFREFERFTTATMNAFVGPVTGRYLGSLSDTLSDATVKASLHVMMSSGGVASAHAAAERPGDAAALRPGRRHPRRPVGGRARRSRAAHHVRHGRHLRRHRHRHRGRHRRGVGARHVDRRLPAARADARRAHDRRRRRLDRVRRRGRRVPRRPAQRRRRARARVLRPRRDRRRRSPTRTSSSGGSIPTASSVAPSPSTRDAGAAVERIAAQLSGSGSRRPPRASSRSPTRTWRSAIRSRTIEKGHDPREFALVAFGGAGPLHAAEVADLARDPRGARAAVPRHHVCRRAADERPQVRPDAHGLPDAGLDRRRAAEPRARRARRRAARLAAARRRGR